MSMISPQRRASTRWAAVMQNVRATVPRLRRRCCARVPPVGIILVRRMEVRPFSDQQIALIETFADQAVIAIENVRLYNDLREREARIRRLVDSNIIGIFIWDFEGRILEANDEFLRMVSYDREDLVSGRIRWAD